jgi:hypothetical protein
MGTLTISTMRNGFTFCDPSDSDYQVIEKMVSNNVTHEGVIVRYKSISGIMQYDKFGTCANEEDLRSYFNSPYCHDVEIFYLNPNIPINIIPAGFKITDEAPPDSRVFELKQSQQDHRKNDEEERIKESNLARWQKSEEPIRWADGHQYSWNHQDWLLLLEDLRKSSYWPMNPDKVGAVLEEIKRERASSPVVSQTSEFISAEKDNKRMELEAELYESIKKGTFENVKRLVDSGISLLTTDVHKNTVVHIAAEAGNIKILQLLVDNGTPIDRLNWLNETPLSLAARNGHFQIVKYLCENGATTHGSNLNTTPLGAAAVAGHLEIVKYLVEQKNVPLNSLERPFNATPVFVAASFLKLEVVKYLLEKGADPNIANAQGETAISRVKQIISSMPKEWTIDEHNLFNDLLLCLSGGSMKSKDILPRSASTSLENTQREKTKRWWQFR